MKTQLPFIKSSTKYFGKLTQQKHLLTMLLGFILTSSNLFATHFRYGVATATRLSETSTTVTYRLNVSEAWRLNSASSTAFFSISGGNTGSLNVPMTIVTDPSGQWSNSTGSATITLNKSATPTVLRNSSCCKISTIMNNRDRNWDEYIILRTDQPGSSPVSTLPAIINMPINAPAATYTIPATDPDAGSTLTFGSPSFTGNLSGQTQPPGFSINSTTGQITLNTVGKLIGQQYNALVTVTDNHGNQIMLDFLINMVGASNPPVFDYTATPVNGTVYNVMAGQNLSFPIKATDGDAGSTVSMSVAGLPSYITTGNFSNAALPATGNPSATNFSWTPSGAQIGTTNVLNFIATDNVGVQTTTSVTIRVVAEPAPVFIAPTAPQNSVRQIETGQLFSDTIVAQSSLGSNVSVAFATGIPTAATLSPAVPTAGSNPGQTILNWTPTPADFGVKSFGYQATISAFPTIFTTRNFTVIVNTTPAFTSSPVNSVVAGQTYSYNVTVSDANIPYGDTVDIVGSGLPAWLTLVSTGNGIATLSGTPTLANVGVYQIELEAKDIYHHGPNSHVHQHFNLAVLAPASITAGGNTTFCQGSFVTLTANSGDGLTYQWKKDGNNIIGANSISYNVTSSGSYTAEVTGGGVSATSNAISVSVNPSVVITNCPQTQYEQIYTDSNSCTTTFNYNPTISGATDVTYTFSGATTASGNGTGSGSSFNIGQTTVTITALGICGTATCSFVVTVIDNKKPIALTKNVTVYLNANGTASVNANDINNGSSDNCGPITVSLSQTGTICGTGTENQNVILNAPAGAKITAINFASYGNPTGTCSNFTQGWCHAANSKSIVEGYALQNNSAVIPASNGVFGDPCFGTVKRLFVQATWTGTSATNTFNCSNVGNNTVTLVVTDANGNVSTQTATVTVIDNIAPTAGAQNVTIQLDANGAASTTATAVNNGSSDNCGIASVSLSKTSFNCSNVGNNNVTLTVTDVNGNVSTANAVVTVQDNIAPTAVAQNVTIQLDANGAASTTATAVNNGSSDNCGIASLVLSKTSFDCTNVGNNNVTLTVTDINGNVSTANAVVTVQDNIAPTAIAKNVTVTLANGGASVTAAMVNNGSYDNCGIASLSVSPSTFNCGNIGNNTVTLTVTDVNGNVSTTTSTVNVVGVVPSCSLTSAPRNNGTVIGSTNTLAAVNQMFLGYGAQSMNITCTATGGGPFTYSWSGSGLSNYNIANPVFTPTTGGNYTLTCTITNSYGCQSTCSITICVIDVRSNGGSPNNPKVLLCHYPPGNSNNPQTLSISVNAVPAHLGQHGGDKLGSCNAVCGFAKTNIDGDMYTQETMDGEINLIVYPNPSNSAFNFKLETESTEPVTITLYDMSGRMVMNLTNQNPTEVITIAQEMAAGVYMANVTQGEFVKTVKITKVN